MKDRYCLTEYTVSLGIEKPLTLGLIADLHEREPKEVLRLLRLGKPDLIMVAGDILERHGKARRPGREGKERTLSGWIRFALLKVDDMLEIVSKRQEHNSEWAFRFLEEAGKIAPVFLSRGNHEQYLTQEDIRRIQRSGATLLDNADCETEVKGVKLMLGGLSSKVDLKWLERYCRKDGCKILLCHHPEFYECYLAGKDLDLILAGHAHGGQIRILRRGVYSPGQGFFPKYTKGVYDHRLVVTAGCSNTASVPRLGNPCEVVMVRLVRRTEKIRYTDFYKG